MFILLYHYRVIFYIIVVLLVRAGGPLSRPPVCGGRGVGAVGPRGGRKRCIIDSRMPSLYVHYRIGRALRVVKYVCSRHAAVEYKYISVYIGIECMV